MMHRPLLETCVEGGGKESRRNPPPLFRPFVFPNPSRPKIDFQIVQEGGRRPLMFFTTAFPSRGGCTDSPAAAK